MTAQSPAVVNYEYEADVRTRSGWKRLPVTSIAPSLDRDRRSYASAALTLEPVDRGTWELLDARGLDPELGGQVRWRIRQLDSSGNLLGRLPRFTDDGEEFAVMHVRTASRTLRGVRVEVFGRELLVEDKIHLSPVDVLFLVPTTTHLVESLLSEVFGVPQEIVAGDDEAARVLAEMPISGPEVNVSGSYLSTVETDLNSRNCRLLDLWGLAWFITSRESPPHFTDAPSVVKLGTYTTEDLHTLPDDVDPIVIEVEDTVTRDGEWGDAVIVRGESFTDEYSIQWQQTAAQPKFTRAKVITIDRGEPWGNLAESISSRAMLRGRDLRVVARVRLDVLPGMTLETHLRDEVLSGVISAVSWDMELGTMSIHVQSALTAPSTVVSSRFATNIPTVTQALNRVASLRTEVQPSLDVALNTQRRLATIDASIQGIPQ